MTELEKIEQAKMYMDKLANGINPIDDTMAPDDDLINNVRLSRCFLLMSRKNRLSSFSSIRVMTTLILLKD